MKKSLLTFAFILILFSQSTFCNKKLLIATIKSTEHQIQKFERSIKKIEKKLQEQENCAPLFVQPYGDDPEYLAADELSERIEDYKYRRACYITLKNRLQVQLNIFKGEK